MAVLPLDADRARATKADEISVALGPEEGGPGARIVQYARPLGSQGEVVSESWLYVGYVIFQVPEQRRPTAGGSIPCVRESKPAQRRAARMRCSERMWA